MLNLEEAIKNMGDVSVEPNGWNIWAKYVLKSLEEQADFSKKLDKQIEDNKDDYVNAINELKVEFTEQFGHIKKEIGIIKTKTSMRSALIGAVASVLPSIGILIYFLIRYAS